MAPRKAPPASPAVSTRHTVEASPARSTRSTRARHVGDDTEEWDRESMISTISFKVPNPRGSKKNTVFYPSDTSVQIAAAFNAAQSAQSLPTPAPTTARSNGSNRPATHRKTPSTATSDAPPPQRALSPAESILSSARALSPVSYFLRPADTSEDYSGEFNSFASLGSGRNGHGNGNTSGETSYNYSAEDAYVRAAQKSRTGTSVSGVKGPRLSDGKKKKARDDDMPYRPGKDDELEDVEEDSEGEGEEIVRQGGLSGRADTRGKRAERGEGYLGNGLGLQPRQKRAGRKSGEGEFGYEHDEGLGDLEGSDEEQQDGGKEAREKQRGYSHSPFPDHTANNRNERSPTPAQIIRATLTPRADRSGSASLSRRRQPSTARTIVTNLLHGIVLALRFIVDMLHSILNSIVLRPIRSALGSSRSIARAIKRDWLKYLFGLLALGLALRLAERPWRSTGSYSAPDVPPSSMQELVDRLTSIEHALSSLSSSNRALEQHEIEGRKASEAVASRIGEAENAITSERKRLEIVRVGGERGQALLQSSIDSIRSEVDSLATRIGSTEAGIKHANGKLQKLDEVDREVQALRVRVGAVERDVQSALEDGRLRTALERILPSWMPVRKNDRGTIDIDPIFWTEMKRILVGQGEVEGLVRQAMGVKAGTGQSGKIDEGQLDRWAAKLYDEQVARGDVVSRSDFIRILEGEVSNLKETMEEIRSRPSPALPASKKQSSTINIKSAKGDDLTSALQELIDAALLRYSKDTIARPDYALFTAGGRVVPSITSDTLVMSSPGVLGRVVLGRKPVEGLSPAHALMPDNTVGKCWPFRGDKGQLGVLMSRRVVVGDLTVEHAASEVAVDIRSAPKDVEVWGLVEGAENLEKAKIFLDAHSHAENASMPPSPNYLLLASFSYDPSLPNHVQTFPVDPEIQAMGIDMGIVVFKVTSNHGGDFTCLYRVRVHGQVKVKEAI